MINKITPIVLLLLSLCISASSQNIITGTKILNKSENKALDALLKSYEIYEIDIQKKQFDLKSTSTNITLELGNASYEMNLYENNLNVKIKRKENLPLLMGGSLRTGGTVSLTFNDDFIYGFIKSNGQHLFIEPLSYLDPTADKGLYILYDIHAVKEDREHVCGVTEVAKKSEQLVPMRTITTCKIIDIAIANTYDMVTKYTNAAGVANHNLGVLNNVQTNYRSEFDSNIEFEVVANFIPTSSSDDPLSPQTSTTNSSVLLGNFRNWARGPGNAGGGNSGGATGEFGVDYNMASLWTDRNISFGGSSGTVGLAYTPGWHHLLEDYTTTAASLMSMVTHEKGHNFDASHDGSGTNFIMAPSVTLTEDWSPASKTSINNRLASQNYLDNCSTLGAPTAGMNQSALALCVGSTVEFEEQSQYGATRDWEFTNGSPATSTDEKETVTYNTAGLHAVKVTSYNATGSDIAFGYVDVQAAPPIPCTPSGTGAVAITNVSISNMNNSSTGGAIYQDFSCSNVATVLPNTAYSLVVGVAAGTTRIRYFVDYNDDGDFNDSSESSPMFTYSGSGNLGLTLNTPASMTTGQLLRLRIITSTASIGGDGCTSPTSGQVEDYSFYVEETQVFGCTDPNSSNYNSAATIDDGSCTTSGTQITWYRDLDNDNFGDLLNPLVAINQPVGYVLDNTDCNDNNAAVNPGATEICDGLDNNCNGQTDEGVTNTYYLDSDGDGFGGNTTTQDCSAPGGYVSNNNDCNDNNANVNPNATEICDGIDNNCNNQTDEGVTNTYYFDSDNDGFGGNVSTQACSAPNGYVSNNTDCNDNNAAINPSASEICDGIDNNCNNQTDEGCGLDPCDGTALVINAITQNTFRASISINSTATVTGTSDILFTAGQCIDLEPGFEIVVGTDFEAKIEPCANTITPSPNPSFNFDLGDLNDRINSQFEKGLRFNATIFNGENQLRKRQQISPNQLLDFVNNAPIDLEQGMYKLLLEQGDKEIKIEMFIIR